MTLITSLIEVPPHVSSDKTVHISPNVKWTDYCTWSNVIYLTWRLPLGSYENMAPGSEQFPPLFIPFKSQEFHIWDATKSRIIDLVKIWGLIKGKAVSPHVLLMWSSEIQRLPAFLPQMLVLQKNENGDSFQGDQQLQCRPKHPCIRLKVS